MSSLDISFSLGMMWLQYTILIMVLPIVFVVFMVITAMIFFPLALLFSSWFMKVHPRKMERRKRDGTILAFFHPYCNAGGGGERVLWIAVNAVLMRYPGTKIYIYTGDKNATPRQILQKAQTSFNIKVDEDKVNFIYLNTRVLVEGNRYPYFTLLLQSIGSMVLGFEALLKLNPDVYIDTMGYAFTMPIFKYIGRCTVGTYTHYPTITTAMMKRVQHRVVAHNNASIIARNPIFTWIKMLYYQLFGWIYGYFGRCADIIMVNGTWTEDHINELWGVPLRTHRVYPPCETNDLKALRSLVKPNDPINIVSVGQFRPEKDHPLMLQSMYELRNLLVKNEQLWNRVNLIFVGSCRNEEDEQRVQNLKDLAKYLSLEKNVKFRVNASYGELLEIYQHGTIGLHAMWNEHFGISVVECMAAGLIMVAHRSGGPLCDIIETSEGSRNGFLAVEADDYAKAILEIIALSDDERDTIRAAARASVDRFSQKEFEKDFLRATDPLIRTD